MSARKRSGSAIRLAAAALAAAFMLTGCHGSRGLPVFKAPERFDDGRKYEITFWAKNDTNKQQTKIYEQAISDFTALYPNVEVQLRLYTDYGKIYNDVITNIATGTTPNVCITYPDHIATYRTGQDVVVPLDGLLDDEKYGLGGSEVRFEAPKHDEVIGEFLSECYLDGQCYALPFMRSTEACYVNKDFVEKLGYTLPETLTWDFIWEVSEAAAKKGEDGKFPVNGQEILFPFMYKSTDNMMIQLLRQMDAPYSDEAGDILIFSDETKEVLLELADHVKKGAFSTFKISGYPGNFFNAGQCIFAVDSTAGSTWMGSHAPLMDISSDRVVDFETAVFPVPQIDPEHPKMISQGPSVCIFNKEDPGEVLASWLFAQYLLSDEIQVAYAETEGYVPVTSRARETEAYRNYLDPKEGELQNYAVKIAATKMLLDHTADTFVTPVFNGSASLRDAAGAMIENVTKSVRRKEKVNDAYVKALYEDMNNLYRLDRLSGTEDATTRKKEMGPLPAASKALLAVLAAAWVLILIAAVRELKRRIQ